MAKTMKVFTSRVHDEMVEIGELPAIDRTTIQYPLFGKLSPLPDGVGRFAHSTKYIWLERREYVDAERRTKFCWYCKPEDADAFQQELEIRANARR